MRSEETRLVSSFCSVSQGAVNMELFLVFYKLLISLLCHEIQLSLLQYISCEDQTDFNSDHCISYAHQDDFEMMKDVDVSGDFVAVEETSENIEEKEVKE